ncbi:hypothetical protein EII29_07295 [Leptotrichia sp. OH3620_COT-345]|uniref:hypothetical protein n=1 Tax=Leptotrichia sp. OH3620_COT-345 TaxID=2491048 RepID=UPI000F64C018|nr:hypothetical protein [Leptotrichia sp. OH3620_COT-345]RRD39385.1 hypothetical protein EII29_07295 [Leptotrichia sp. OH3620_COT-345]
MRKITIILFLMISIIGISEPYKVTVETGVKISEKTLRNNNIKIEKELKKIIRENSKKEVLDEILNMKSENYSTDSLFPMFFVGLTNIVLRNTEIEIKEIEYISETEADIKLKIRSMKEPDIAKIYEKVERNFKKKTGLSLESIETDEDKKRYLPMVLKDFLIISEEYISKMPKTLETVIEINSEKEGGEWLIDTEEFLSEIIDK